MLTRVGSNRKQACSGSHRKCLIPATGGREVHKGMPQGLRGIGLIDPREVFPLDPLTTNIALFLKAYQPAKERSWHLSLWSTPTGRAWCVHDVRENSCVALVSGEGSALPAMEKLPLHPASVSFIAVPEISTLVPEGVLEGGREAAHLELVHGPLPTDRLRDEPIDALSARCIYLHDDAAEKELLARFPSARPIALQALLIKGALARSIGKAVLLLHRGHERCDLVIAHDGAVLLANSFHAPTATDMLYFALFALDRVGVKPDAVQLRFGGVAVNKEEEELLARYFRDHAAAIASDERTIAGLALADPHRQIALLEQWPCVS